MFNLEFHNTTQQQGVNVTIRNGDGWHNRVSPGDKVKLGCTARGIDAGTGTVLFTAMLPFDQIPAIWLQYEHDLSCHSIEGLKEAMHSAYGRGQWGPMVTAVFYHVDEAFEDPEIEQEQEIEYTKPLEDGNVEFSQAPEAEIDVKVNTEGMGIGAFGSVAMQQESED